MAGHPLTPSAVAVTYSQLNSHINGFGTMQDTVIQYMIGTCILDKYEHEMET